MPYYTMPELPEKAEPPWRKFVEQVRSVIGKLEQYGQPIEVSQPFYTDSAYATAGVPVPEVAVYRADRDSELLYATWTPVTSGVVEHTISVYHRQSGPANQTLVQRILGDSVATTDWLANTPKQFTKVASGQQVRKGEILTLEIVDAAAVPAVQTPIGLLSLYLRRATR